jgi:AcrR family transcriptional regulator
MPTIRRTRAVSSARPAGGARGGTARRGRPRGPRTRRAEGSPPADTRTQLLVAAAAEFAARGFAGASVDRIARGARVNKAMIYYHFRSKAALYREILAGMFRAVGVRVQVAAVSAASPEEKIRGFIEAIAAEAEARPYFPPIWFREIAEGGTHLDERIIGDIAGVLQSLVAIIDEGVRAGRFTRVNALLVHAGIVAPVLLFFASAPLRERIERAGAGPAAQISRDEVVAHVRRVTLNLLAAREERTS